MKKVSVIISVCNVEKNRDGTGAPSLFVDVGVVPWNKLFRRSFLVDAKLAFRERVRHSDVGFVCLAVNPHDDGLASPRIAELTATGRVSI